MNSPVWWRSAISHHSVLLIFHRSLFLRLSELQISALCQAWTYSQILVVQQQRKLRVRLKENLLGKLRKRKSNRPLNPKPIGLRRMSSLVLRKWRKKRVCRNATPSVTPSVSDIGLPFPLADDSTEEEGQDADCVFYTCCFSEDHNGEELIRCAKYFRWAHTLCAGMEEDFVCESCQRKTLLCS